MEEKKTKRPTENSKKDAVFKVLKLVLLIIIIIILLYAAWKTDFAGIREFTKNTLGIIGSMFEIL